MSTPLPGVAFTDGTVDDMTQRLIDQQTGLDDAHVTQADLAAFLVPLFTDAATVATSHTDGTEDILATHTIPAGTLAAAGDRIDFDYRGNYVGHATATRNLKVYFGGTAITALGPIAISTGANLRITGSIVRLTASTVRAFYNNMVTTSGGSALVIAASAYTDITATLGSDQVFKVTGTAAGTGAASADINVPGGFGVFVPAP